MIKLYIFCIINSQKLLTNLEFCGKIFYRNDYNDIQTKDVADTALRYYNNDNVAAVNVGNTYNNRIDFLT